MTNSSRKYPANGLVGVVQEALETAGVPLADLQQWAAGPRQQPALDARLREILRAALGLPGESAVWVQLRDAVQNCLDAAPSAPAAPFVTLRWPRAVWHVLSGNLAYLAECESLDEELRDELRAALENVTEVEN